MMVGVRWGYNVPLWSVASSTSYCTTYLTPLPRCISSRLFSKHFRANHTCRADTSLSPISGRPPKSTLPPTMAPSSTLINKIKVQLKLGISRLRMVQSKDTALAKQQRRELAQLLEIGKLESARIRVENIIRSDVNTELLEILELYCELLSARAGLLEAKECDPGLEEAVKSIMFAAPKISGVKELSVVRQLLGEKFGKEFALAAAENADGKVPERVTGKLRVEPPPRELVEAYLEAIAEAYGVDYPPGTRERREREAREAEDEEENEDEDDDGEGGQKVSPLLSQPLASPELSKATPPNDFGPKSPVSVVPPSPSTDNVRPKIKLPGTPEDTPSKKKSKGGTVGLEAKKAVQGPGGKIPDVDELQKRFAQLKR